MILFIFDLLHLVYHLSYCNQWVIILKWREKYQHAIRLYERYMKQDIFTRQQPFWVFLYHAWELMDQPA